MTQKALKDLSIVVTKKVVLNYSDKLGEEPTKKIDYNFSKGIYESHLLTVECVEGEVYYTFNIDGLRATHEQLTSILLFVWEDLKNEK